VISNEAITEYDQTHDLVTRDDLERRSEIFKALGDKNRLKILYLLLDGEKCVSELLPFFDILQPTVSIHLLSLQDLGFLSARRHGRRRYYSLASEEILIHLDRFFERLDASMI
jgi:ArsR family transcriptional regulator